MTLELGVAPSIEDDLCRIGFAVGDGHAQKRIVRHPEMLDAAVEAHRIEE